MGWRGVVERIDAPLIGQHGVDSLNSESLLFWMRLVMVANAGWHAVDGEDPFVARVKCVVIYL